MKRILLQVRKSNWETVAFLLFYDFLITTGKKFTRSALMRSDNIDKVVKWLTRLNHKAHPEHPEQSLQRKIQDLRNKGFIVFHGNGEYELTDDGVAECHRVANEFISQIGSIDDTIEEFKHLHLINYASIDDIREETRKMSSKEKHNFLKRLNLE
jgi:DNA-binding PadR family transcriptional regulator